jgi:hypothetical protein
MNEGTPIDKSNSKPSDAALIQHDDFGPPCGNTTVT